MNNDWQNIIDNCQLFWQYPVRTEKEFYFQNRFEENYIGFPWATVLDKHVNFPGVIQYLKPFIENDVKYYTCCQHIRFRELESIFKELNIKKLYTPHKCMGEDQIGSTILQPCPLYAVNIEDHTRNNVFHNKNLMEVKRKYLYSFMGGLQPGYLTDIRDRIFNLLLTENTYIENTGGWHFNELVYTSYQNRNETLNISLRHKYKTQKYNEVLLNSRFSLCPSGTGPNSIRFWESLAVGAIPVLLSDTLELPPNDKWDSAVVRLDESNLNDLPDILSNISEAEESERRQNCLSLYKIYRNNYSYNPEKICA